VAMANYGRSGFLSRLTDVIASFSSRPAVDMPSPFDWGGEDQVRRRFGLLAASIEVMHRRLWFEFDSVDEFFEFWEQTNPPQNALKAMLSAEPYEKVVSAERALVEELNESNGGGVKLTSSYLLVLARKLAPIT